MTSSRQRRKASSSHTSRLYRYMNQRSSMPATTSGRAHIDDHTNFKHNNTRYHSTLFYYYVLLKLFYIVDLTIGHRWANPLAVVSQSNQLNSSSAYSTIFNKKILCFNSKIFPTSVFLLFYSYGIHHLNHGTNIGLCWIVLAVLFSYTWISFNRVNIHNKDYCTTTFFVYA